MIFYQQVISNLHSKILIPNTSKPNCQYTTFPYRKKNLDRRLLVWMFGVYKHAPHTSPIPSKLGNLTLYSTLNSKWSC